MVCVTSGQMFFRESRVYMRGRSDLQRFGGGGWRLGGGGYLHTYRDLFCVQ